MEDKSPVRCGWAGEDPLYIAYHDTEWGVPVEDDRKLFEFLVLEGAQAGLSWLTILRKRKAYAEAFADFDPLKVASFTPQDEQRLLENPKIVRNRRKIAGAVTNARAFLKLQEAWGSFGAWLWNFVDGKPVVNHWKSLAHIPSQTPLSSRMSKELKKRGFCFVGPVICYSYMQAVGMVQDHLVSCFRHGELPPKDWVFGKIKNNLL